jgi:hypothetical protein
MSECQKNNEELRMKAIFLMTLTVLFSLCGYAKSNHLKNPFLGNWCSSMDAGVYNPYSTFFFNSDGTILSFSTKSRVEWSFKYNPTTRLIAGNMEFITKSNVRREAGEKNTVVLFDILPDGKLIWIGPAMEIDFPNINRENLNEHLLMDAREYNMSYERCDYIGS